MLTDAAGTVLVVETGPANERDEKRLPSLLEKMPRVFGPRGRPREKPRRLLGDAGYGFPGTIAHVRSLGIRSLLKPRGTGRSGSGLGRERYVVEQTLGHFNHFRRLRLCYEKTPAHWQAFHELAAALHVSGRLAKINQVVK